MLALPFCLLSQTYATDIPVYHNGNRLAFPWIGGLDHPRFQNIDLNQDGFQDIVVFDAQDSQLLTFLHVGGNGSTQFVFAPEYISLFPTKISNWLLLADYNQDGEPDLFTCDKNSTNLLVYKNKRKELGYLSFEIVYAPLIAEISPGTFAPLSTTDIPSITDVDSDGDLDILSISLSGTRVELYRNVSNDPEVLDLRIRSLCWGSFLETADTIVKVQLHQPCNFNQKTMHIGGTLCALSLNGDSLIDLLLSHQGLNNVVALYNGGTRDIALITQQDTFFPPNDTIVHLQHYPAIFYVDANGDNQKDLLFTPNGYELPSSNLYYQNHSDAGWLYLNYGNNLQPHFKLAQKNFFYQQTLDGGSYSVPVVWDEDLDGDFDLLLMANRHTSLQNNQYTSQKCWIFYRNVGSNQQPVLDLQTYNYHNWNQWPLLDTLQNLHPAVADIDQDGDMDFFIGHKGGRILFLENEFDSLPHYVHQTSYYANVQVQANSAPHFADIDNDNDLDLIVGVSDGSLVLYENNGTPVSAQWSTPLPNWGNIYVTDEQNPIIANAKPFWIDFDKNGSPNLLVGNSSGFIKVYEYQGHHHFQFQGDLFQRSLSLSVAPYITSFSKDSLYFFIGNAKGGVYLFKEEKGYVNRETSSPLDCIAFPNPFEDYFQLDCNASNIPLHWELWNSMGQKIEEGQYLHPLVYSKPLPAGLYLLKIQRLDKQKVIKIWKN